MKSGSRVSRTTSHIAEINRVQGCWRLTYDVAHARAPAPSLFGGATTTTAAPASSPAPCSARSRHPRAPAAASRSPSPRLPTTFHSEAVIDAVLAPPTPRQDPPPAPPVFGGFGGGRDALTFDHTPQHSGG